MRHPSPETIVVTAREYHYCGFVPLVARCTAALSEVWRKCLGKAREAPCRAEAGGTALGCGRGHARVDIPEGAMP